MTEPTTVETIAALIAEARQQAMTDDIPDDDPWAYIMTTDRLLLAVASALEASEQRLVLARGALNAAKITHLNVEDCWYSCPESSEGCCDESQTGCNCGADEHNAAIDVALSKIGSVDTTERAEEAGE